MGSLLMSTTSVRTAAHTTGPTGFRRFLRSLGPGLIWTSYRAIARIFKWLSLVLTAYVLTAFIVHVDWAAALRSTLLPHVEWTHEFFAVLVALFGTTISPYLFFWQAAQEVEEERA